MALLAAARGLPPDVVPATKPRTGQQRKTTYDGCKTHRNASRPAGLGLHQVDPAMLAKGHAVVVLHKITPDYMYEEALLLIC